MKSFSSRILIFLVTILFVISCEKEKKTSLNEGNGKDREQILKRYADSLVIPAYADFKIHLDNMLGSANTFISGPNINHLIDFRNKWEQAYISWQTVELFDFGPAELHTLRSFYNIYPADVAGINTNFSNTGNSLEVPASYPQQGFPALDYLINGVASNDTLIIDFYTHPTEGSKRLAYIQRLCNRMNELFTLVNSEWSGSFKSDFISKSGLDINASTSKMVNGFVLHFERYIRSGKIGIPSGVLNNGIIAPEKSESFYKKGLSKLLLKQAHQSFVNFFKGQSFFNGQSSASLSGYLDALDAKDQTSGQLLSQIILNQMNLVTVKIDELGPDIAEQITNNPRSTDALYNEMQTLVRLLKVDMTSAMSITITYTDNDGD